MNRRKTDPHVDLFTCAATAEPTDQNAVYCVRCNEPLPHTQAHCNAVNAWRDAYATVLHLLTTSTAS